MTEFLTVSQVVEIHDEMLRRYGGLKGIRDENLLHPVDSAETQPFRAGRKRCSS